MIRVAILPLAMALLACTHDEPIGANESLKFPNEECSTQPAERVGKLGCKFLGRPDGIPTYSLFLGKPDRQLLIFDRSIEVYPEPSGKGIAVNSYEGSNFTDCYVLWDKNILNKRNYVSKYWESEDKLENGPGIVLRDSDHRYFTCSKWIGGSLKVSARWERSDGSYLVGEAELSPTGKLNGLTYRVDASEAQ
ncbi:hypothetical protein [Sphingopyxis sp.]|uniref:hypothetical protein n=1 Tax=Sphingopyxis sp. TaxID=1908224 RepID=UPI002E35F305|nr:hypothetical protein [Sphingopyxis sp.]